jgi:hypothetical protein
VLIVRRSKLTGNFVQLPNEQVLDERLGRIARSVLAELIARPPGWQTTAEKLAETAQRHRGARAESKRAYRMAFAELEEFGYMTRERTKIPKGEPGGGGFVTILTVYDTPQNGAIGGWHS